MSKKPSPEAVERTVSRMVKEALAKCAPARVDADRKAKPRTKIVGHFREGVCVGPASIPENYEVRDVPGGEDGET